jgi:serine protease DegS
MRDIMGALPPPATCQDLLDAHGVLIAMLIIQRFPQWVGLPSLDVNLQQAPQTSAVVQGPVTYADAVVIAAPAVVNLYTTKVINKPAHPLFEDPQFRRYFGDNGPKQRRMESSLGSGVIMSPEGYILTNNHVTTGADQIVVALRDGRETLARVVGSDPETDLAVLKIDLKSLPAITLGRSDGLRVGDVALAIGNPFGVGQTVTMGIISATGRNQLGLNSYEDFIQTDAAINPGNSGGALVDANGNLTGINTAIFSKSGGSQGIGFAIPVKLAMEVMKSIIEHGQVIRGWLGIEVQPLTKELAESFGLTGRPGIVVAGIFRDGPAQKAGLQLGDVILSINGEPAGDGRKSMNQVARIKPTDKVAILVMRNGKEIKLAAEIGLRPPPAPVKEEE